MATIRVLLGIICLAAFGWSWGIGSSALGSRESLVLSRESLVISREAGRSVLIRRPQSPADLVRSHVLTIAKAQLGVREATRKNDGHSVEQYLAYTGNKKGDPWCAAFVSWVFGQAGFALPRTAWSPALFPLNRQTLLIKPAVVFGIYFPELKRIAHCGLVEKQNGNWIYTIEGNTNFAAGREGDGVYRKIRHLKTIGYYADWVKRGGKVK